ncbi:MAG: DNA polymerase III subunit delta [Bacillota bacterium]|jgi:DNA polymerase-3 subunit delta
MKYKEALDSVQASPGPAYLLHGEELFLHEEFIEAVKRAWIAKGDETLNFHRFEGTDEGLLAASGLAGTIPFLGRVRVIVVGDGPVFASKGKEGDKVSPGTGLSSILSYLEKPPAHSILVFSVPQKGALSVLVCRGLAKSCATVDCGPMKGKMLENWIQERFEARGATPTRSAVAFLAHAGVLDLWALDNEIEKAFLYANSPRVEEDHVKRVLSNKTAQGIFNLADALGARDTGGALRALGDLLEGGAQPAYILFMLARHVRYLVRTKDLDKPAGELASLLEVQAFLAERYHRQAKNFSSRDLEEAMEGLLRVDLALKTGEAGGGEALKRLIIDLTSST